MASRLKITLEAADVGSRTVIERDAPTRIVSILLSGERLITELLAPAKGEFQAQVDNR